MSVKTVIHSFVNRSNDNSLKELNEIKIKYSKLNQEYEQMKKNMFELVKKFIIIIL